MDSATYNNQLQVTFDAFHEEPLTMLQVSKRTGILRANICWYIKHMKEQNKIALVRKGYCPHTRHPAGFYTTNPDLMPEKSQYELFQAEEAAA